jgi:hypothetical protein
VGGGGGQPAGGLTGGGSGSGRAATGTAWKRESTSVVKRFAGARESVYRLWWRVDGVVYSYLGRGKGNHVFFWFD